MASHTRSASTLAASDHSLTAHGLLTVHKPRSIDHIRFEFLHPHGSTTCMPDDREITFCALRTSRRRSKSTPTRVFSGTMVSIPPVPTMTILIEVDGTTSTHQSRALTSYSTPHSLAHSRCYRPGYHIPYITKPVITEPFNQPSLPQRDDEGSHNPDHARRLGAWAQGVWKDFNLIRPSLRCDLHGKPRIH